jgi:hypothetical protein
VRNRTQRLASAWRKSFPAGWTFDVLEVDAAYFRRRDHLPTLRAYGIERHQHSFKIDFPRAWHGRDILVHVILDVRSFLRSVMRHRPPRSYQLAHQAAQPP